MGLPSTSLVASAVPTTWWLPTSAILLAVLGVLLLAAGMREPVLPGMPDEPPSRPRTAHASGTALVPPSEPPHGEALRAWGWGPVRAEALGLARPGMPRRPADCLGADLAMGPRAESAHLATVPLPRPGECGDLRDVVMELATLRYRSTRMTSGSCVLPGFGCQRQRQASSDDRIATALFAPALLESDLVSGAEEREPTANVLRAAMLIGPPDRPTAAMLAAEYLGHERGDARRYRERTATGTWLVPSFRRIRD